MAGHSHWAGIKHKKGLADKKRGKLFSRLSKNLTIAVKDQGGDIDPDSNLKLRYAIDKAKEGNMPKANIEKAISKGAGVSAAGVTYSELMYEGYAPGGVALMAEIITDNRNRTASEVRKLFEKTGGKLGASGCVSYLFDTKGVIQVPLEALGEDDLMEVVLDAGAEDLVPGEDFYDIFTTPSDLETVRKAIEEKEIPVESYEVSFIPQNKITLDEDSGRKVLNMVAQLEDYEDIEAVYTNHDIPADILAKLESED